VSGSTATGVQRAVLRSATVPLDGGRWVVSVRTSRAAYLAPAPGDADHGEHGAGVPVAVLHGPDVSAVPGSIVLGAWEDGGPAWAAAGERLRLAAGLLRPERPHRGDVAPDEAVALKDAPVWEQRRASAAPAAPGRSGAELRRRALGELAVLPIDADLADRAAAVLDALGARRNRPDGHGLGAALDRLVGLGPGLTPSGDDMLVGMLAALRRPRAPLVDARAAGRLADALAPRLVRTTAVSRFYLAHALAGRFGAALLDARDVLVAGDEPATPERVGAMIRLRSVGATSGTDLLAGLLTALARTGPDAARMPARSLATVGSGSAR